jgi:hypothetical protein
MHDLFLRMIENHVQFLGFGKRSDRSDPSQSSVINGRRCPILVRYED